MFDMLCLTKYLDETLSFDIYLVDIKEIYKENFFIFGQIMQILFVLFDRLGVVNLKIEFIIDQWRAV